MRNIACTKLDARPCGARRISAHRRCALPGLRCPHRLHRARRGVEPGAVRLAEPRCPSAGQPRSCHGEPPPCHAGSRRRRCSGHRAQPGARHRNRLHSRLRCRQRRGGPATCASRCRCARGHHIQRGHAVFRRLHARHRGVAHGALRRGPCGVARGGRRHRGFVRQAPNTRRWSDNA